MAPVAQIPKQNLWITTATGRFLKLLQFLVHEGLTRIHGILRLTFLC